MEIDGVALKPMGLISGLIASPEGGKRQSEGYAGS